MEKRLAVCEVWIAEMVGADSRVATSLYGIVKKHAHKLLVLSELPDEPAFSFLEGNQPAFAKFFPRAGGLVCQRRADLCARRCDDIAGVAVSAEAGNVDPGAVLLV